MPPAASSAEKSPAPKHKRTMGTYMRIFDTHCHLADEAFKEDLDSVLARMAESGIRRANLVADPCEESPNQERVLSIAERSPNFCASAGVHPHNASRYNEGAEELLTELLKHPKMRLLGEIGLDYHYDLSPRETQRRVFDRQLDLSHRLGMPVQLHIREAHGDALEMLRERKNRLSGGIMHCYTGSMESAKIYLDLGFYISFSGALTFKNAPKLAEAARFVPKDRLLIETDCPYMAPVPLRGRRNEPSFIVHTLQKLAELRGEPLEETAETVYRNGLRIFGIGEERI